MTTFEVDLNTRIIGADTKVYLARAGKNGHLFVPVFNSKAIGPDLPNLGVNLATGLEGDHELESKIKRARALSKWLRTPAYNRGNEPQTALYYYEDQPKGPGFAQVEGVVRSYFELLQHGDIVVIPNPSAFGNALIAEILPLEGNIVRIPGIERFNGYNFDGRRFGHFKEVRMADLPPTVVELSRVPTGFAEIYNARVKKRIFQLLYDDYVIDDEFAARIITTKDDFNSFDSTVLNALITMVTENIDRLQHGGLNPNLVDLERAAFMQIDADDLQVRININSPGHIAVIAKTVAPLVIGSILAVLVAVNFDANAITPEVVVSVTNSQINDVVDLCSQEVGQLSQSMLRFLSVEPEFQRNCALLREAHDHTGAHTNFNIEVKP
ncbi:hypothetical protein ACK9YZ_10240 [Rhizobium sp. ZK1]|uniref:hypothetical protein n=1 Tax=Rhizobium sp. ZK1 TaxID=3389872 RepID=UPI0039F66DC9